MSDELNGRAHLRDHLFLDGLARIAVVAEVITAMRFAKYRREAKVFVVLFAVVLAWDLAHDGWWYAFGAAFCTVMVALWVFMWLLASLMAYMLREMTERMEGTFDEEA